MPTIAETLTGTFTRFLQQPVTLFRDPTPETGTVTAPDRVIDFERLVGKTGWQRLAPAIRTRFDETAIHNPRRFYGIMTWVDSNLAGWMLGHLARLAGTPLAPWRGTDIPIEVDVDPELETDGQIWARRYYFPGKPPVTIASTKRIDRDGGMMECLGRGFGMKLRVYEENGTLCFRSLYHFWQIGKWRLRLPGLQRGDHALRPDRRTPRCRSPLHRSAPGRNGRSHSAEKRGLP